MQFDHYFHYLLLTYLRPLVAAPLAELGRFRFFPTLAICQN